MQWVVDLLGCEEVDDRFEVLDVGQAAGQFAELSLWGIDVEEVATVWSFLDFRDLSTSASELDMVADLKVSHYHQRVHPTNDALQSVRSFYL